MAHRTALYEVHRGMGAKLTEFAGWELPVEYTSIREEHLAVRNRAGLFDISHMGEIEVVGKDASSLCQLVTTNDISKLKNFQAQYTLLCNHEGGVIDDIIVYKFGDEHFFICVNAVNTVKDYEWIKGAKGQFRVEVLNRSHDFSQLALQGSYAEKILNDLLDRDLGTLKRFYCQSVDWNGVRVIVARTGYTGEDGFEIFLPWDRARMLWDEILGKGKSYGIQPCGLGARDTLRVEMGYPLYGHEIDEDTNPFEAGLDRFVRIDKGDFIGKKLLVRSMDMGLEKRLIGFEMIERGIPRQGYGILRNGTVLGKVTSGTLSPSLQKPIGMGYLRTDAETGDGEIQVEIRGTHRKAKIVSIPFYKKG